MNFKDQDWETLLPRIKAGTCTPFLGAGVNDVILPLGKDIAEGWAKEWNYPLESKSDLAKVAQFLAIHLEDQMRPKETVCAQLNNYQKPLDFSDDHNPINILAKLPFPLYVTTNYDELLFRAIEHHGRSMNRKPVFEFCRWKDGGSDKSSYFRRGTKFTPSVQTPMVYHLHGHASVPASLVLTEDDYLDFLVNMSKDLSGFLPARIQEAIAGSSLLFIGYGMADIDFRVLFRGLLGNLKLALGRTSVAVQLPYDDTHPNKANAEAYITQYIAKMNRESPVRVYWGNARKFAEDLWGRWSKFNA